MEVKGRLWDSRRLGQSSGTYPLRLLAGDLCSFSFAPPPSPAGSQGLGPGRKGARERSTRSWGSGQEAAEEAGSGAGIEFHPCFPPRGERLDKVPWGRGRQACATGWQWSLGSGRLRGRTGEHFGSTVEGAEPLSPAL